MNKTLRNTIIGLAAIGACTFGTKANASEFKFTPQEAKYQYSFFYNLGRRMGVGHLDTSTNAQKQLRHHGFPPVSGVFRSTVMKCFDNTGDAYCWTF